MLTELWLNCCKIQNVEAVSCPFTPPQSAMCQIALISDLIMAAGGNADVCAKTSFKLKFSRASLWSSWRSLSFRPLSRSTSYKRGNRKLEWKTLWSPSWTLLPSKMFEQLWNSALLSIFFPQTSPGCCYDHLFLWSRRWSLKTNTVKKVSSGSSST